MSAAEHMDGDDDDDGSKDYDDDDDNLKRNQNQGLIQCVAVNHVGKAVASTELCVFCVPRFASEKDLPELSQLCFKEIVIFGVLFSACFCCTVSMIYFDFDFQSKGLRQLQDSSHFGLRRW